MTLSYGLQMFCNILSITIIAGGLFLKIPQIVSVIKAGNTEGLSLNSVILEECAWVKTFMFWFDPLGIVKVKHNTEKINISGKKNFLIHITERSVLVWKFFFISSVHLNTSGNPLSLDRINGVQKVISGFACNISTTGALEFFFLHVGSDMVYSCILGCFYLSSKIALTRIYSL